MTSISPAIKAGKAYYVLMAFYGTLFLVFGTDKFFNFIVQWDAYTHPALVSVVPPAVLIASIGFIEIVMGVLVLFRKTVIGGYAMGGWLLLAALNLILVGGFLDIAIRDIGLALGAFAMALLTPIAKEPIVVHAV